MRGAEQGGECKGETKTKHTVNIISQRKHPEKLPCFTDFCCVVKCFHVYNPYFVHVILVFIVIVLGVPIIIRAY